MGNAPDSPTPKMKRMATIDAAFQADGGEGREDTPPGDDDCERAARSDFIAEPGARDLEEREAPRGSWRESSRR